MIQQGYLILSDLGSGPSETVDTHVRTHFFHQVSAKSSMRLTWLETPLEIDFVPWNAAFNFLFALFQSVVRSKRTLKRRKESSQVYGRLFHWCSEGEWAPLTLHCFISTPRWRYRDASKRLQWCNEGETAPLLLNQPQKLRLQAGERLINTVACKCRSNFIQWADFREQKKHPNPTLR